MYEYSYNCIGTNQTDARLEIATSTLVAEACYESDNYCTSLIPGEVGYMTNES